MQLSDVAQFELKEAAMHLEELIKEIEHGDHQGASMDIAYAIPLAHIVNHLLGAYNFRNMNRDAFNKLSQEDFEAAVTTIPLAFFQEFKMES